MSKITKLILFSFITLCFYNCRPDKSKQLFKQLPAQETGINFINQLSYSDSLTVLEFEYMFNGAGVALADINNDGLLDIFFAGNMVSCKLYLNKGKVNGTSLHFEDITEKAGVKTDGWAYGVSVVDINQDGFQDFYICKAGNRKTPASEMKNLFFINNGDNTFTEKAAEMNLDDDGYDIQTAFFDYDKDGDLDMYLLRNAFVNYNRNVSKPRQNDGQSPTTDKLFRNDAPKGAKANANLKGIVFTDVSKEAGILYEGFGLGVAINDINNDNYPDIYVSNDFLTNDLVYINNKNGTFSNKASTMLHHQTYNGMGNDLADINNDGLNDIMVVDMLPPDNKRWKLTMMGNTYDVFEQNVRYGYEPQYVRNTLQLNNGNNGNGELTFSEIGQLSGVHATEWSWAPLFADYDNDGYKDLFIANGYRQDVTNLDFIMYGKKALFMGTPEGNRQERLKELAKFSGINVHNYIFKNNDGNLTFTDVSEKWGLDAPSYSNGAVYGDLDNDGDLDLVTNNLDQVASIYENQLNKIEPNHQWLRLNFKGEAGNYGGLGTKVWVWQKGKMQYNYFSPYRGYLSTVEPFLHFGLQKGGIDSLKVLWNDGKEQIIKNPKNNQILTLDNRNAQFPKKIKENADSKTLFIECSQETQIQYQHHENNFVDFKTQALLPRLNSRNGPGLAVADVNADGLEDFYVGGAAEQTGRLFIQQKNGKFLPQKIAQDTLSDDMGALFFDADNDGDQDLYVVSGGVANPKEGDLIYQHRLYINNGKKGALPVFTREFHALPNINSSGSSIVATDFDHDGDLDLFIGGRVRPNEYPLAPRSYLLKNTKGKFTDVTPTELKNIGMVTSALWTDYDNDGWQDLMLAGEFMPITFFKNEKGSFNHSLFTIQHSSGWWNSLIAGDFDKDGDIDYVAGNLGLNSPYKASTKEPVCIYAKDYDKNGLLDPIMCHFVDGEEQIVHARDDLNKQITAMRTRFKDYTTYAETPFHKSFTNSELADAYIVKSERFESSYIENLGNGKFTIHSLPIEAQFSPIFGMLCQDFDNDGNLDVLAVGNSFATEVQTGRYDARGSLLLRGDGKGNFKPDHKQLNIAGDNKSIACLSKNDGNYLILIGSNNSSLMTFKVNPSNSSKQIALLPTDAYAIITENDNKKHKQEFYFGNTYLSQSSRRINVSTKIKSVEIVSFDGKKRQITL